VRMS